MNNMSPRRRPNHPRSPAVDPAVHQNNFPDPSSLSLPTLLSSDSAIMSKTAAPPQADDEKKLRVRSKKRVAVWIGFALAITSLSRDGVGSFLRSSLPKAKDVTLDESAWLPATVVETRKGIDIIPAPSSSSSSSSSPACKPHFQLALPGGTWTNASKFKRLYFYHVRKAGGTNLRRYFEKVASHHGLRFDVMEFGMAEDPGSHPDEPTFYVTHLREPVSRSLSHFKYQGRWDCEQLVKNDSYVPTEAIAQKLETWNSEYGHEYDSHHCEYQRDGTPIFRLSTCAVNCYAQWFSGLSCPDLDDGRRKNRSKSGARRRRSNVTTGKRNGGVVPMTRQYEVARAKLFRYNLIVINEMLKHPEYVNAIDRFFGVPGVGNRDVHPWCEVETAYTNKRVPLVVRNETIDRLTKLNEIDVGLYREMTDCSAQGAHDFLSFDATRFESNATLQLDHEAWERMNPGRGYMKPGRAWRSRFDANDGYDVKKDSSESEDETDDLIRYRTPSCRPHFDLALPDGNWTSSIKFKRLYFYHSRKAGGTNLKQYFRKVAKHHGLDFHSDEYVVAEDPGSHEDATFYVTNLREPLSRSISHFKYEGRWDCKQLTANASFVPTEENARTLEEWSENYGRYATHMYPCANVTGERYFKMLTCGVMCYSQWFAGLSCPPYGALPLNEKEREISLIEQYQVAKMKLGRYNLVIISEWLKDPGYVAAVERMFGVPGVAQKKYYPWCEAESHSANEMIPLEIKNETMTKLTQSNRFDSFLYDQYSVCLKYRKKKDFPKWDASRFEMNGKKRMDYEKWERLHPAYRLPKTLKKQKMWLDHPSNRKWRSRLNTT
ncbi:hypothetical protein ACHAXA_002189 [Cyclostephanos tholiformis]|uniref:Uncharacterized protein n=1 Tax=Cyclostephanos tholiformis TaxID=382380 RepID=A0ABD3RVK4_9STRA